MCFCRRDKISAVGDGSGALGGNLQVLAHLFDVISHEEASVYVELTCTSEMKERRI